MAFAPEFEHFVAPARARPAFWRLILGMVLLLAVYSGLAFAMLWLAWVAVGEDIFAVWASEMLVPETPTGILLLLATFVPLALGAAAAAEAMHGRHPGTLFGRAPVVLRDFARAAGIALVVLAIWLCIWLISYRPLPNLDPGLWAMLLPISLLGVLIQTGAEELVFRGYLQQQLAARYASPIAWAIIPSFLFGIVHWDPSLSPSVAGMAVVAAGLFGLMAADLTARTGSIGAAWGFHFANNSVALLLLSTQGTLPGLALYVTPYSVEALETSPLTFAADVGVFIVIWLAVRKVVAR
ncbi:MAG: CPBP family intramembrane glutamic endopeptidase [Pseudomonadota bacterium]